MASVDGKGAGGVDDLAEAPARFEVGSSILSSLFLDHPHDVALLHDEQLLPVDLDLGARPLAKQHLVASLDVEGDDLAGLVARARAGGDDLALLGLLGSGVGNDDAARTLGLLFDAAHDHTIMQRTELHGEIVLLNSRG